MSDKVRVGLISTSWWAEWMYLPSLKSHPDAELVAICGRNHERAAALASAHDVPQVFTDYRAMLADAQLDAVIVATPDDGHKAMVLAAFDAGLHVLCEKPLANSVADAAAMLERARASGRKHMVLYTWRWQPHFRYLKALLDDGTIGRPLRGQFSFIGGSGHDPSYQWRHDGSRSNGVAADLGSHMIDLSRLLLGDIAAVSAHTPRLIERSDVPVNDTAHLIVEFADGAQGVIDVTTLAHLGDNPVTIGVGLDGSEGSLELEYWPLGDRAGLTIRLMRRGEAAFETLEVPESYYEPGFDRSDPLLPFRHQPVGARLFIDAILGDFKAEPGFETGLAVQRVIDAALRSHQERRWVDVG